MKIPLSLCVPENLVSRDGFRFSRPVPRQPAHLHNQAESLVLTYGIPPEFRIPWYRNDKPGYKAKLEVKWTSLIGQRSLSPCRVGKTPGYTPLWLLFSKTVPCILELYPELSKNETLPSTISSPRNHFPPTSKGPNTLIFRTTPRG